jgi:hypothetical protein
VSPIVAPLARSWAVRSRHCVSEAMTSVT